jgi:putative transposase
MPYRRKEFYPSGYYHIFNRGINRGKIFFSTENYNYCLRLIQKYTELFNISVIAFCLMPNHYHLVLRQNSEKNISDLMQLVFNAYVQAVNRKMGRKGTLFEGRFKHIQIDKENYVLHLCRYIHLNPVRAKLVKFPEDWLFSNYQEWIGKRNSQLVDPGFIAAYFSNAREYQKFVMDYRSEKEIKDTIGKYLLE